MQCENMKDDDLMAMTCVSSKSQSFSILKVSPLSNLTRKEVLGSLLMKKKKILIQEVEGEMVEVVESVEVRDQGEEEGVRTTVVRQE